MLSRLDLEISGLHKPFFPGQLVNQLFAGLGVGHDIAPLAEIEPAEHLVSERHQRNILLVQMDVVKS